MYKYIFKRVLDFSLSLLALVLLSPVFALVAVLVGASWAARFCFGRSGPGKNSQVFTMYKFRTMTDSDR